MLTPSEQGKSRTTRFCPVGSIMVKETKIEERLARYIELFPIPVAVFDQEFNLVDYNSIFEKAFADHLNDPEFLKSLFTEPNVVKSTLSGEQKKYYVLYFPTKVVKIKTIEELLFWLKDYVETLKFVGALSNDIDYDPTLLLNLFDAHYKDDFISRPTDRKYLPKPSRVAGVSVSNFIERSLIEGYLRRLKFKPVIKWGNESIVELINTTNPNIVIVSDENEVIQIPDTVPVILVSDFGRRVQLKNKYPHVIVLERPVSFENFKLALKDALL